MLMIVSDESSLTIRQICPVQREFTVLTLIVSRLVTPGLNSSNSGIRRPYPPNFQRPSFNIRKFLFNPQSPFLAGADCCLRSLSMDFIPGKGNRVYMVVGPGL